MSQLPSIEETGCGNGTSVNKTEIENLSDTSFSTGYDILHTTIMRVNSLLSKLPNNTLDNVTKFLNDWQINKLAATELDSGIICLLNMLFSPDEEEATNELHCTTAWDNIYCWPQTVAGTRTTRSCTEALENIEKFNGRQIDEYAYRDCLQNGTWSRGFRTNYSECAKALLGSSKNAKEGQLSVINQYMVFIGSIASLASLAIVLTVLCCFRSVWSERMKIHVHLMSSLVLRYVVYLIISEPLILQRNSSYRDYSILCKAVILSHLYATVTSTSWMLVQGIYLNGKLTANVFGFGRRREFLKFYIFGWGMPVVLVGIYLVASTNSRNCWEGYAEMKEIWIVPVPLITEMLLNGLLLCNILRVVVKKRRCQNENSEFAQCKSVAKITLMLFPILGLNNLLFLYNPGGEYETLYVTLNLSFGSIQGVLVAIVYCFNCTEVHKAIRNSYRRFATNRMALNVFSDNRNHPMIVMRIPDPEMEQQNDNPVVDDIEDFI